MKTFMRKGIDAAIFFKRLLLMDFKKYQLPCFSQQSPSVFFSIFQYFSVFFGIRRYLTVFYQKKMTCPHLSISLSISRIFFFYNFPIYLQHRSHELRYVLR